MVSVLLPGRVLPWKILALSIGIANVGAELKEAIRGVRPEDQEKYAIAASSGTFKCKSDQPDGSQIVLPFNAVNDDFCDCVDGSDEPGTGACAGQKETLFYCPNDRSVPSYVYSSRINDGVCDCCDGSDERTIACPNICEKEGIQLRKDLEKREAAWLGGVRKREKLVQTAKRDRENSLKELSTLRENLASLEAAESSTRLSLENATAALEEEQERQRQEESLKSQSVDALAAEGANKSDEEPAVESPTSSETPLQVKEDPEMPRERSTEVEESSEDKKKPEVSEYTKWMDGAEEMVESSKSTESLGEKKPEVSEYAKWMDGAEEVVGSSGADETAYEEEELSPVDDVDDEQDDTSMFVRLRNVLVVTWNTLFSKATWENLFDVFGKSKTPLERFHAAAAKAHDAADKALSDARKKIEGLEKKVEGESDELRLAYSALEGRCLSKKLTEYTYEVCFFKNAKQDSTSLGNWERWDSDHVGIFDDGQYCPGGPSRSLRVRFECGADEEISEVTEPSRCTYVATVIHPSACVGTNPVEASKGNVRMPTDEL